MINSNEFSLDSKLDVSTEFFFDYCELIVKIILIINSSYCFMGIVKLDLIN